MINEKIKEFFLEKNIFFRARKKSQFFLENLNLKKNLKKSIFLGGEPNLDSTQKFSIFYDVENFRKNILFFSCRSRKFFSFSRFFYFYDFFIYHYTSYPSSQIFIAQLILVRKLGRFLLQGAQLILVRKSSVFAPKTLQNHRF